MSSVKFYYVPFPRVDPVTGKPLGDIFRPLIPVRLGYRHNVAKFLIDCLADSGSDFNLFPASWGENVGINIKKGKVTPIRGIGASEIQAYRHTIKLYVGSKHYTTEADFSYEQNMPLLGREGFFNLFKHVVFNEKHRYVELG